MDEQRRPMKTSNRLLLGIGSIFVIAGIITVALVNNQARKQALVEAETKARIILNRNLATHTYFTHQLKPKLFRLTGPISSDDYFEPTWMSSTYAVREIDKYFKPLEPGEYYYKESAINARSPENEADAYEKSFIEELNENSELMTRSVKRVFNASPYFVVLHRGEEMEESCLRCHSTPEKAPGDLVRYYGPERSFNRKIGDVVSANSIRVPLSAAYAIANRFSLQLSIILITVLGALFLLQHWFNKLLLFKPLSAIHQKALLISNSDEHLGEEIPLPAGRELNELTAAFNKMSIGLRYQIDHLEERVQEQTSELTKANNQLKNEIEERQLAEEALRKAHDELELQVKVRTAELMEINEELKAEIEVRKQTKQMLQKNEKLLQTVFDGISDPLILLDENLRVKILNNAALRYYQKEKKGVINSFCYRVFWGKSEPCDGCQVPTAIAKRQSISFERSSPKDLDRLEQLIIYRLDENDIQLGGAILRIHDVTEIRLMEREMIHAEKLASLGLMVSCITHEITNPISAITFNAPILEDYIKAMISIVDDYAKDRQNFELFRMPYPQFRKDAYNIMTNIVNSSKRVGTIVSNLRKISHRKEEQKKQWFNLKPVIERTVALMRAETNRYVKFFEINIPENLPEIYLVPDTVEQILINLLTNAVHASDKEDSQIKLNVEVGDTWHDHLIIEISDNGCGMDKETLSKIFNPFFSTKEPDKGTGLGLYVCQNLIQKLDGRIEVRSEVGKGSVFRLIIPEFDRRSMRRL
jgi:signal transduction histidine kinase